MHKTHDSTEFRPWVADALPQLSQLLGLELELMAEFLVVVEHGEGLAGVGAVRAGEGLLARVEPHVVLQCGLCLVNILQDKCNVHLYSDNFNTEIDPRSMTLIIVTPCHI